MATAKSKIEVLENTGIKNAHSNGGRNQTLIFKIAAKRFRISIHSESYDFQSYARLYQWTDEKGFAQIISKSPARDYKIDIAYRDNYSATAFAPIIADLQKLATKFV